MIKLIHGQTFHSSVIGSIRSMNNCTHFLLTRFNISNEKFVDNSNRTQQEKDLWLKKRFALFENYCLPSVLKQDTKDFEWLVLFDSQTPPFYKKRISEYSKEIKTFIPLFLDPGTDEVKYVVNYIQSRCFTDFVLTTRLDNDDMIRSDYLSSMQKSVVEKSDNIFFSVREGYQYDVQHRVLCKYAWEYNHFTSRLEKIDNLETVWVKGDRHDAIDKMGQVIQLMHDDNKRRYSGMWVEVCHDSNVANSVDYETRMPIYRLDNRYQPRLGTPIMKYLLLRFRHAFLSRMKNNNLIKY